MTDALPAGTLNRSTTVSFSTLHAEAEALVAKNWTRAEAVEYIANREAIRWIAARIGASQFLCGFVPTAHDLYHAAELAQRNVALDNHYSQSPKGA